MRRTVLVSLAAAILLAGCSWLKDRYGDKDPTRPTVVVRSGKIESVSPDPLVFEADQKNVTISWSLPAGSNLTFPADGIAFEKGQEEIVRCAVGQNPQTYTCLNRHTRPGEFKYTVRVLDAGRALEPLDPTVRNK